MKVAISLKKKTQVAFFQGKTKHKLCFTHRKKTKKGKKRASLKKYFQEILPNYDKERVYVSNIKKVISWYNILIKHNLIDIEEPQAEAQTETTDNENK